MSKRAGGQPTTQTTANVLCSTHYLQNAFSRHSRLGESFDSLTGQVENDILLFVNHRTQAHFTHTCKVLDLPATPSTSLQGIVLTGLPGTTGGRYFSSKHQAPEVHVLCMLQHTRTDFILTCALHSRGCRRLTWSLQAGWTPPSKDPGPRRAWIPRPWGQPASRGRGRIPTCAPGAQTTEK